MGMIENIPAYYPLMSGLIRAHHQEFKVIDIDIIKLKCFEEINVLVKTTNKFGVATYETYSSTYSYKEKKEFNPTSHVLNKSAVMTAAKDIQEERKAQYGY